MVIANNEFEAWVRKVQAMQNPEPQFDAALAELN
jgi:hypothetical protein